MGVRGQRAAPASVKQVSRLAVGISRCDSCACLLSAAKLAAPKARVLLIIERAGGGSCAIARILPQRGAISVGNRARSGRCYSEPTQLRLFRAPSQLVAAVDQCQRESFFRFCAKVLGKAELRSPIWSGMKKERRRAKALLLP